MSKKRKLSFLLLTVTLLSIGFYLLFREKPVDVTVFKVKRGDVEATVTATTTGTVKARAISKISSQYSGRIERILKREGTRVKKGEVILELENRDAKAQQALAEANLKRQRELAAKQLVAASVLDAALAERDSRAARLVDELEMAGIVGPFDGSKARQVLCESEADLEAILRSLP